MRLRIRVGNSPSGKAGADVPNMKRTTIFTTFSVRSHIYQNNLFAVFWSSKYCRALATSVTPTLVIFTLLGNGFPEPLFGVARQQTLGVGGGVFRAVFRRPPRRIEEVETNLMVDTNTASNRKTVFLRHVSHSSKSVLVTPLPPSYEIPCHRRLPPRYEDGDGGGAAPSAEGLEKPE